MEITWRMPIHLGLIKPICADEGRDGIIKDDGACLSFHTKSNRINDPYLPLGLQRHYFIIITKHLAFGESASLGDLTTAAELNVLRAGRFVIVRYIGSLAVANATSSYSPKNVCATITLNEVSNRCAISRSESSVDGINKTQAIGPCKRSILSSQKGSQTVEDKKAGSLLKLPILPRVERTVYVLYSATKYDVIG